MYEWSAGQTESVTVDMWEASLASFGGYPVQDHPGIPFRVRTTITVERVDPDGSALVETVVEGVELAGPPADAEAETLLADLRTLVGVRLREQLDGKGYLIASQTIDPLEDDEDLHPTRGTARDNLEHLTMRLPLEPIGVGGVWEETVVSVHESGLTGTDTLTMTVADIDADGRVWLDVVAGMGILPQEIPGTQLGLDDEVTASGDGFTSGSVRVDLGRVIPTFAGSRRGSLLMEIPTVGDGVSFEFELRSGLALAQGSGSDPAWPLPPVEAVEESAVSATEADDDVADSLVERSIDVVVLDPGAEPRQALRYDLAAGQIEDIVIVMRMGMRTKVEGAWSPWLGMPAIEMAGTSTVTAVRDDGSYDIEVVYTDARIPEGTTQLPPESLEEMEAGLATLVGLSQLMHMDDRGRILHAETVMPPGATLEAMQPGQLDAMTQDFIDPLPLGPVGVGATWEVAKTSSDAMGFVTYGSNTITLMGIGPDGRLRVEGDMDMTADRGPMTIEGMEFLDATIERFDLEGQFIKTVDLGLVNPEASSRGITDYAFSIALGDTAETTELQMSMEFDTWLVSTSAD